jgi:hypothetical protein
MGGEQKKKLTALPGLPNLTGPCPGRNILPHTSSGTVSDLLDGQIRTRELARVLSEITCSYEFSTDKDNRDGLVN